MSEERYEVTFLSPAYGDMAAAIAHIGKLSGKAAASFVDDLERQTAYLETMPEMYPVDEDHPPYRRMVLKDYLVYYTVSERQRSVEIFRILPARMELSRFFIREQSEQ